MAGLTTEQVKSMTPETIITWFRQAARFQRENKAITWEHGSDLVSIVAIHGDLIADHMAYNEWDTLEIPPRT